MTPYIKVQVHSAKGLVFEKDFPVSAVFDRFLRFFLSELVEARLMQNREKYAVRIVPQYGAAPRFNSEEKSEESEEPQAFQNKDSWMTLAHEGIQTGVPMDFFTIEVVSAKRPNNKFYLYRRDLRFWELLPFIRRIDTALCLRGVIDQSEQIEHRFIAAYDDLADFRKEQVNAFDDSDEIKIELVPDAPRQILKKSFSEYKAVFEGKTEPDNLKILIESEALKGIEAFIADQADPTIEAGGILLGQVFQEAKTEAAIVDIQAYIPAQHTQANEVSLVFTHETWAQIDKIRKAEHPDQVTLGWFHSHPFTFEINKMVAEGLAIFFSSQDRFLHETSFKEPWHVAMVLGVKGKEKGFFQWQERQIIPSTGYYIYEKGAANV